MAFQINYTYADCVRKSEAVAWTIDEVMPPDAELDFERPFLPNALAPTELSFLSTSERLALNQIAGNAYLNLFQFVEEYILATMMQHAQGEVFGEADTLRALTRMVDEELKHQQLFHRFREAFDRKFGVAAAVLENAGEVAGVIMGHSPLAVLLITLHIEWMTQKHYTECVKDDGDIDEFFKSLLHKHWIEESQHARIDTMQAASIAEGVDQAGRDKAVNEYLGILGAFDGLLQQQASFDVDTLEKKIGRTFSDDEKEKLKGNQLDGYHKTFIWYGMSHVKVVEFLEWLSPEANKVVGATARYLRC